MNQKGVKTKGKKDSVMNSMNLTYNIHIQYNKCTYIYTLHVLSTKCITSTR